MKKHISLLLVLAMLLSMITLPSTKQLSFYAEEPDPTPSSSPATTVTIVTAELGYENAEEVTEISKDGVTITFDKGTNSDLYDSKGDPVQTGDDPEQPEVFVGSINAIQINNNTWQGNSGVANDSVITIEPGDRLYILGWAVKDGTNVDWIIWTVDGAEMDCSDKYQSRVDVAAAFQVDSSYTQKSGFGLQNDMMELLGVNELASGVYTVSIWAVFEDGTDLILKDDFQLVVEEPEVPPTDPNLRVAACNLSFADSIYIKYAIGADDLEGIQLLIWTAPQSEYVYGTQNMVLTSIGTQKVSGVNCAIFQYDKLAAKQMVDNIYARAFVEIGGTRFYSEVKKYSVLQYAYNKTGRTGTASSDPKLITLLYDMLQYGASAQQYLNYKTGRLATMNYYQVKVVGGVLSDMCDSGLYLTGESVVLTAPATNTEGLPFACWQDSNETIVGTEATLTITVGGANAVYTAKYGSFSDYSMFEYESNGDGTCVITGLNAHDFTDIVLPDSAPNGDVVIGIDVGAFAAEDITSITIPASVTSIGKNAFKGCSELTDVYYAGTQAQWGEISIASGNDALLTAELHCAAEGSEGLAYEDNGDGTCTITGIGTCTDTDVIIPNEIDGLRVTKIARRAFSYNAIITSIKLSENVVDVGDYAFYECYNLNSVTILNCDVRIGNCAIFDSNLTDIYFNGTYEEWDYALTGYDGGKDGESIFDYFNVKIHTLNTESSGLAYEDNGDGTCTITGIGSCSDTNVYIPWYIGDLKVVAIGNRAFENQSELTAIHISNSVKSIGTRAFYGCAGLTEMAIPGSVTSIGTQIFYKANNIQTVYYNAQYWPGENENQFLSNGSIKKVVFGGREIGYKASENLGLQNNVEVVEAKDSVIYIGWYAFYGCSQLVTFIMPDSVRSIGNYAFSDCPILNNVFYNGTINNWCNIYMNNRGSNPCCNGASLFVNGVLLTDAVIPDDITSIGEYAFTDCISLTTITIPESVTSIGEYAFMGCTNLTTITIPDSVTSIGSGVFRDCASLANVTIPDTVASISESTFAGCTSLTSITIPDSVTSIGIYAFNGCTGLTTVTIPDSVTSICEEAFCSCTSLSRITIPDSVIRIGYYAFYNCTSLESVYYTGSIEEWNSIMFDDSYSNPCYNGAFLYINGLIVESQGLACSNNGDGTCTITGMGDCVDRAINIPGVINGLTVTGIGGYAFSSTNIVRVIIPDSVMSIGYSAFSGCMSITSITIPDSVTRIGDSAFFCCTSLTSITMPDSVTSISERAFYNCTSLTSITIPDSVTSIGDQAFYNCTSLTSITIPDSVTSIGDYALSSCTSLTDIYYTGTAEQWNNIQKGSYWDADTGNYTLHTIDD